MTEEAHKVFTPDQAKAYLEESIWRLFVGSWKITIELAICQCGRLKLLAIYERHDRRLEVMISHSGSSLDGSFPWLEADLESFMEHKFHQVLEALRNVETGHTVQLLTSEESGSPMRILGEILNQLLI